MTFINKLQACSDVSILSPQLQAFGDVPILSPPLQACSDVPILSPQLLACSVTISSTNYNYVVISLFHQQITNM